MFLIKPELYHKILTLINKKIEGHYWDYKQEWHCDNERLLLDILCLANTLHNEDCYLIIGVADNGEIIGLTEGSPSRKNQADVLDLLSNTVFAGDNVPSVAVETIKVRGKEIDILTVFNSYNVPFYLKSKSKRYNLIQNGYIYSRDGDRNTPINVNSTMQYIEMLWKKRLGLSNPPLEQIVARLKNKVEWKQLSDTYYNIYNPDFKLIDEWDIEDRSQDKRPFYSYNQCNESTSFSTLKILCRETILKEFEIVTLDSGRYSTPVPEWGFIHDPVYKSQSLFSYRYIIKDSIDYSIQQFLYDEENQEQHMAKYRFDEVILYFDNKEEQEEFHKTIEDNPKIVEQYIEDAKLGHYLISSNNKLEIKDVTEKLVTGFAFNRFLFDYRRRKQGINVKRIKSVKLVNTSICLNAPDEISKHQIDISESVTIKHSIFNRDSNKPLEVYKYKVDKYWMREFLNFLEPIITNWNTDYSVNLCDGYEWVLTIKYSDGSKKIIKGNVGPYPEGEEVERRIKILTKYKVEPMIF